MKIKTIIILCFLPCWLFPQNNALNFDGIDDYINLNSIANDMSGETNFTIEFWMKADLDKQIDGIRTTLFSINPSTNNGNGLLIILGGANSQEGKLLIYDEGSYGVNFDFISNVVIGDNVCHHIAYVRNESSGVIYVDGEEIGSHTSNFQLTATDLYSIGQEWDDLTTNPIKSQFYNGEIDDFRIWNTARSSIEIKENMNTELTGNENGLFIYYNFNQGVGSDNNSSETSLINNAGNTDLNGLITDFEMNGSSSNFIKNSCELNGGGEYNDSSGSNESGQFDVTFPNVFTPNGDGINEDFYFSIDGIFNFECEIYDRWGKHVYTIIGIDDQWSGINFNNGKYCSAGVYFICYTATSETGMIYKGQGNIHLIK